MPVKQRQQAIKSFNEDSHVRVILMSLRCGSNGWAERYNLVYSSGH